MSQIIVMKGLAKICNGKKSACMGRTIRMHGQVWSPVSHILAQTAMYAVLAPTVVALQLRGARNEAKVTFDVT